MRGFQYIKLEKDNEENRLKKEQKQITKPANLSAAYTISRTNRRERA